MRKKERSGLAFMVIYINHVHSILPLFYSLFDADEVNTSKTKKPPSEALDKSVCQLNFLNLGREIMRKWKCAQSYQFLCIMDDNIEQFLWEEIQRSYFAFLIYFLYLLKEASINRCISLKRMLQLIFLFTVKTPKVYEEHRNKNSWKQETWVFLLVYFGEP